jgi:hypothetical protein
MINIGNQVDIAHINVTDRVSACILDTDMSSRLLRIGLIASSSSSKKWFKEK